MTRRILKSDEYSYAYIFVIGQIYGQENIYVDNFMNVSPLLGHDPESYAEAKHVADKLGAEFPSEKEVNYFLKHTKLRERYCMGDTVLMYSNEPKTRDNLEEFIKLKDDDGTLESWIAENKW